MLLIEDLLAGTEVEEVLPFYSVYVIPPELAQYTKWYSEITDPTK